MPESEDLPPRRMLISEEPNSLAYIPEDDIRDARDQIKDHQRRPMRSLTPEAGLNMWSVMSLLHMLYLGQQAGGGEW